MKGEYFMDNFVILQQMVAIDRAQNRAELRSSIQTLLRISAATQNLSEFIYLTRTNPPVTSATPTNGVLRM